jgi:hypothetical protein
VWLLPPAAWVKAGRNQRVWQDQVMAALTTEQRAQFMTYSNKAAGWFIVGAGAALAYTVRRMHLTQHALHSSETAAERVGLSAPYAGGLTLTACRT